MKALVYSGWDVVEVKEVPRTEVKKGEALLRVEACGICGSELEAFRSHSPRRKPPLILGHEFCGTIEKLSEDSERLHVGQKVVANSVISCGKCYPCLRGDAHLCINREVFGMNRPGALAEYVSVPINFIYPRPDIIDPISAALTEPLANGVHIIGLFPKIEKPSMVIIGAGPIGLMALQAAIVLKEANVMVADINETRLKVAKNLGAKQIINPKKKDLLKEAVAFSGQDGVDFSIDAVGSGITKNQSINVLRPGGYSCWIGLRDNDIGLESYTITLPEKKVTGSYTGKRNDFELAIKLLFEKKIKTDWVKVFSLGEADIAFKRMLKAEKDDIKAVVKP